MDIKELGSGTRAFILAAWTLSLGALYFVVIPVALGVLGESRGWPAWAVPGGRVAGPSLVAAGLALVAWCNHLFSRIGRGSIVPIDPASHLVVVGPYRYSRNPVFLGYLGMLIGIFLTSGAVAHLVYAGAFFLYLELFVRREEPDLLARFGGEYRAYMQVVPRWIGPRSQPRATPK